MMWNKCSFLFLAATTVTQAVPFFPLPEFRFALWDDLLPEVQDFAEELGYGQLQWDTTGFADIETFRFSDVTSAQASAILNLGFGEAGDRTAAENMWDCGINHFRAYTWEELTEAGFVDAYELLGWDEASWTSANTSDDPASENLDWRQLSELEKAAAINVCYFEEIWDQLDFAEWVTLRETAPTVENCPEGTFAISPGICICFSGSSYVETKDKGTILMKDLKIGDAVKVANNKYEQVYSFGHYNPFGMNEFLFINSELEISATHMIAIDGRGFVPASTVRIGEKLISGTDSSLIDVQSVTKVTSEGAFAPFTASGTIVVNGLLASSFVSMQPDSANLELGGVSTGISWQWLAQKWEIPHRLVCLDRCQNESYTKDGMSKWVDTPYAFAMWLNEKHSVVMILVWAPILCLVGIVAVAEASMTTPAIALLPLLALMAIMSQRKNIKVNRLN